MGLLATGFSAEEEVTSTSEWEEDDRRRFLEGEGESVGSAAEDKEGVEEGLEGASTSAVEEAIWIDRHSKSS